MTLWSVKKKGEEVLQALEQKFFYSPWKRLQWNRLSLCSSWEPHIGSVWEGLHPMAGTPWWRRSIHFPSNYSIINFSVGLFFLLGNFFLSLAWSYLDSSKLCSHYYSVSLQKELPLMKFSKSNHIHSTVFGMRSITTIFYKIDLLCCFKPLFQEISWIFL